MSEGAIWHILNDKKRLGGAEFWLLQALIIIGNLVVYSKSISKEPQSSLAALHRVTSLDSGA